MKEGDLFLEQYGGQSVEELIQLQQTHRIDSLVLAFEEALEERKEKEEQLNGVELTILAVEALERELNNGGYSQFFYNSSVEYAPIIVSSLKTIGCYELAELTQNAINALGIDSLDEQVVEKRMDQDDERLEEALDELDNVFFDEIEEIPAYALFDFIKNNRDKITFG